MEGINGDKHVQINGGTGCGKTTAIPQYFAMTDKTLRKLICAVPTTMNAHRQYLYVSSSLGCGFYGQVGYGAGGERSINHETAKVLYQTYQTTNNYLCQMLNKTKFSKSYDPRFEELHNRTVAELNNLVIMLDEAHHEGAETYLLFKTCNRLLELGFKIKIIISSATPTDYEFSQIKNCQVITVTETQYPIEIKYTKDYFSESDDEKKIIDTIVEQIKLVLKETKTNILVFVPGANECEKISAAFIKHRDLKILQCHSKLSKEEINEVCTESKLQKLIIATNLAESGVTIPNVGYVIDSMLKRKNMLDTEDNRSTTLKLVKISKSNAKQRAGRTGRTNYGIVIRLMSEENFNKLKNHDPSELFDSLLIEYYLYYSKYSLNPEEILKIPQVKSALIKKQLREMKIINDIDMLTPIGKIIVNYPLDIKNALVIASAMTDTSLLRVQKIAIIMAIVLIYTKSSCEFIFVVPKEKRKPAHVKKEYIEEKYRGYCGKNEVCVMMNMFISFMLCYNDGEEKDWCKKKAINESFNTVCLGAVQRNVP